MKTRVVLEKLEKIELDFICAQAVISSGLMDIQKGLLVAISAFDRFGRHMNNRIAAHKAHTTMAKRKKTVNREGAKEGR